MENNKIMNAYGTRRIWFRCMEKRAGKEGLSAVSSWHGRPENAWRAAAANDQKMKQFVEDHLALGKLNCGSAILMNLKCVAENENGTKTYRCGRSWQLTWDSREGMIANWETDLPPAEPEE